MRFVRLLPRNLPALLISLVLCSASLAAQPVPVRFREGSVHAFLSLSTQEGKPLATGDVIQTVRGDRLEVHTTFHFKDGSLDDEQAIFSQRGNFKLISDHHVQRGAAYPHPMDVTINVPSGQVFVRYQEDGKDKTESQHLDLAPDVANGMLLYLVKNLPAKSNQAKFSYVAATPKPRLVHLNVTREDEASFSLGGTAHKASRFQLKVEIGGVSGAIAPMLGKQPADTNIWIMQGEVPAFVRLEGALYPQGPIWVIELAAPTSFKSK